MPHRAVNLVQQHLTAHLERDLFAAIDWCGAVLNHALEPHEGMGAHVMT